MKELWNGRFDSNEDIDLRLWQVIKGFSKESVDKRGICFVGYDTDDGVDLMLLEKLCNHFQQLKIWHFMTIKI